MYDAILIAHEYDQLITNLNNGVPPSEIDCIKPTYFLCSRNTLKTGNKFVREDIFFELYDVTSKRGLFMAAKPIY